MTYHANAQTNIQQRKRIRQSREPYRRQAHQLGVSVATVAKWKRRRDPHDRTSRPRRIHTALQPEAAPLLSWLRKDWLLDLDAMWQALRQTVFPQLSRSAVYRELVRLQLHQLRALRPAQQRRHGKFRACPPGFDLDVLACPRCGGRMRLLATIEDPQVIRTILAHLGLPTEVPFLSPPRPPPARAADLFADMPA